MKANNILCQTGDLLGGTMGTDTHTNTLSEAPWKMKIYLGKVIMREDSLEDNNSVVCEIKNGSVHNHALLESKRIECIFSSVFLCRKPMVAWLESMA